MQKRPWYRVAAVASVILLACSPQAFAQDAPGPANKKIIYSPYPAKTFPNRVYFGDTHLHTAYSADAGMAGAIVGPEEAYRFARGEEIKSNSGLPVKLSQPLEVPAYLSVAFALLFAAAIIRAFGPLLDTALTLWAWRLSAILWIVAFALFLLRYVPVLLRPRVDSKPGAS